MVTAKGILYTVAAAGIAGVVVGKLLAPGTGGQRLAARLKKSATDWLSGQRNRLLNTPETAHHRAEYSQANSTPGGL